MNRRTLLQRILFSAGAIAAAPFAVRPASATPRVVLQRSPLAGFQHHDGEKLWAQLAVGAALSMVREPDNRHDTRAVRIDFQGIKLGYLSRLDNAAVSQLLDRRHSLQARIATLLRDRDPWKRVEVEIDLVLAGVAS